MSNIIKLKKGYNINLYGAAEKTFLDAPQPELFAIKPTDFQGLLRPKVLVEVGQNVKAGTPILFDKKKDSVMICSPVSGEVVDIVRGEKRKLLEVRILADSGIEYETFDSYSTSDLNNLGASEVRDHMLKSGVWSNIIERPYGVVANPNGRPKAIFISGFDSSPLAPDYGFIFKGEENNLQAGINALSKLTDGSIHLSLSATGEIDSVFSNVEGVEIHRFAGPHPAGNVGVQIHHIDPINKGDTVWTLTPQGVIEIGRLFLTGKYDTSRVIALTGSEVAKTGYYKTYAGASIKKVVEGNLTNDHVRYISGNVLRGERIAADGFVGFYTHQVTIIPEGDEYEFMGWIKPTTKKLSVHRAVGLFSFLNKGPFKVDTNTNGEKRAFVQTGTFESVLPMDIYPTQLIKAIMAEDYDEMEALGIYEILEEDFALCEFVDVSKHEIQKIVREGLDLMQYS
jgi:Na+-transporting NADH:ubiquinone oxidoreductase subunit A